MVLKRITLLVTLLLMVGVTTNTFAQSATAKPNVIAVVQANGPQPPVVLSVAPGQPKGTEVIKIDANMRIAFSPDGRFVAAFGPNEKTQTDQVVVSLMEDKAPLTTIEAAKGEGLLDVKFSSDSSTLFYTIASPENFQWRLGLLNLANGKQFDLTGKFDDAGKAAVGFTGIGAALNLSADHNRLYFYNFPPFTDGGILGLYSADLSKIDRSISGKAAFPKAVEVIKPGGQFILTVELSPDGTQLAYLSNDPGNPPQNFQSEGPAFTANVLSVLDLASGKSRVIARAGKGQGLEAFAWTADSKTIMLVGGSFQKSYYVVSPRIYTVDVAANKVTEGPNLTTEARTSAGAVRVCEGHLFFVTITHDQQNGMIGSKLYSAPLTDLKTRSAELVAGGFIDLKGCKTP